MARLSIVIPSYREPLLQKTIDSLLASAVGDIEIIPVLDGCDAEVAGDVRVRPVKLRRNRGMRAAINAGFDVATGEYVMKLDAHCHFKLGYDRTLTENCANNWVVVPRRYYLDETNWSRNKRKPVRDSHFLAFPVETAYGYHLSPAYSKEWNAKIGRGNLLDSMTFQGSCWVVNKKEFQRRVGKMDDSPTTYGRFACENLEVGMAYWLDGGAIKINTMTWYAHLFKRADHYKTGGYSRSYKKWGSTISGYTWAAKRWIEDSRFPVFLDKFWPVPTWPENWREVWSSYGL